MIPASKDKDVVYSLNSTDKITPTKLHEKKKNIQQYEIRSSHFGLDSRKNIRATGRLSSNVSTIQIIVSKSARTNYFHFIFLKTLNGQDTLFFQQQVRLTTTLIDPPFFNIYLQAGARLRGLENDLNKTYHYIDSSYLPADRKLKLEKVVQGDHTERVLDPGTHAYYRLKPVQNHELKV